jgi:hypothetical protein
VTAGVGGHIVSPATGLPVKSYNYVVGATGTGSSAKVKDFGGGLKAVMSKKGPLLLIEESKAAGGAGAAAAAQAKATFYGWPEGIAFGDMTEEAAKEFITSRDDAKKPAFEWKGNPVVVAKGRYGPYAKAGTITASIKEGATEEEIIAALEAKSGAGGATAKGPVKSYREYEVRQGPYGPYIIKPALKQKKFVSLSASAFEKLDSLTEKDIAELYKAGLETKKKWTGATGGSGKK